MYTVWVDLFTPTPTAYCIPHCMGYDLFALSSLTFLHLHSVPIHWFDLVAPKRMSPPPYTTIPLRTASSGLTFLHQRQCPHHHILLFHCILCTAYTGLTFLHQHLLCALRDHCVGCWLFCTNTYCILHTSLHGVWPFCTFIINLLHLQSVPITGQCYS